MYTTIHTNIRTYEHTNTSTHARSLTFVHSAFAERFAFVPHTGEQLPSQAFMHFKIVLSTYSFYIYKHSEYDTTQYVIAASVRYKYNSSFFPSFTLEIIQNPQMSSHMHIVFQPKCFLFTIHSSPFKFSSSFSISISFSFLFCNYTCVPLGYIPFSLELNAINDKNEVIEWATRTEEMFTCDDFAAYFSQTKFIYNIHFFSWSVMISMRYVLFAISIINEWNKNLKNELAKKKSIQVKLITYEISIAISYRQNKFT